MGKCSLGDGNEDGGQLLRRPIPETGSEPMHGIGQITQDPGHCDIRQPFPALTGENKIGVGATMSGSTLKDGKRRGVKCNRVRLCLPALHQTSGANPDLLREIDLADRKSTRLHSSHYCATRMLYSA